MSTLTQIRCCKYASLVLFPAQSRTHVAAGNADQSAMIVGVVSSFCLDKKLTIKSVKLCFCLLPFVRDLTIVNNILDL